MAGFRVEYNTSLPKDGRVVCLQASDGKKFKPVQNEDVYWVAISDFLSGGGDGYDMIRDEREFYQKGKDDASVLVSEIAKRTPVTDENTGSSLSGIYHFFNVHFKVTEARMVLNGIAQLNGEEVSFELDCNGDAGDSGSLPTLPSTIVLTVLVLLFS